MNANNEQEDGWYFLCLHRVLSQNNQRLLWGSIRWVDGPEVLLTTHLHYTWKCIQESLTTSKSGLSDQFWMLPPSCVFTAVIRAPGLIGSPKMYVNVRCNKPNSPISQKKNPHLHKHCSICATRKCKTVAFLMMKHLFSKCVKFCCTCKFEYLQVCWILELPVIKMYQQSKKWAYLWVFESIISS